MHKAKKFFSSLKLSHKITLLVTLVLILPIIGFATMLFKNLEESKISDKKKSLEFNMTQNHGIIQKTVELCNMSTQVILNSKKLVDYTVLFSQEEKIQMPELLNFYKNDISNLEKLVYSNPYLYQIRVYVDSKTMPEMMPILYNFDRLRRLYWGTEEIVSGEWQFDYVDNIMLYDVLRPKEHIVSLVTKLWLREYGDIGIIEVATKMDILFPDIYKSDGGIWTCYIDKRGNSFYDTSLDVKWTGHINEIMENIPKDGKESFYDRIEIEGEEVLIGYLPVKELGGYLLKVSSLNEDIKSISDFRNIFLALILFGFILVVFLIDYIVKIILKQFYSIMKTVNKVQEGDLSVRITDCGEDEIGELGHQVNEMLARISNLMEESIKGELLVKDSEIRALQNQINAHFIYNVLESVKMMAEIDEKYAISDAVTALGKLLRYSMRWVSKNVTVEEEVDYIKNYLALINLRFDYEIYLSLNMPDEIWNQEIPKMSLQPIIENAIYHGIEGLAEDTNIYMKGFVGEDYFIIEITDAGRGMTEEQIVLLQRKISGEIETTGSSGNGLGLKNVQDRIQISFGKEYGISVASKEGCFTKVMVKIPYKSRIGR